MQNKLPQNVDFLKQVERNSCYEGVWPIAECERLKQALAETDCNQSGEVRAKLKFGVQAGTPCLDGRVEADLELDCQRCMEPVTIHVEGSFRFGLIRSEEEAAMLPKEFEPFMVTDSEQSLIELVEDELLLSLPIVARHEEQCSEILQKHKEDDSVQHDTHRPFAGLKDLMN